MAKKTVVEYVDDLDGKPVDVDDLHTIEWSWLGVDYVIDTSTNNFEKIEAGKVPLARLLAKSTRVGGRRRSTAVKHHSIARGGRGVLGADDRAAIRTWAREQGYEVSDRGRVSEEIVSAFRDRVSAR